MNNYSYQYQENLEKEKAQFEKYLAEANLAVDIAKENLDTKLNLAAKHEAKLKEIDEALAELQLFEDWKKEKEKSSGKKAKAIAGEKVVSQESLSEAE